jgi:hypothetical protein
MKTKEVRRAERKKRIYDKIKNAMTTTRADKLVWDLGKDRTDDYRRIEGNHRLEAVQFIGEILSEFDFPITPRLFYAGMKRKSGSGNQIDEGQIWVRAELVSTTGIKDEFTIPIEVTNGKMLPPSLVINDGNVSIIAQSTFDSILDRITAYRDVPFRRNMFSPGPDDVENYPPYNKEWPRSQVLKRDMFTPFASKQTAIRSAMTGIVQGLKQPSQRSAKAPPGEKWERLVRKLKEDPNVDDPYAVAWAQYNESEGKEADSELGLSPQERAEELESAPGILDPNTKKYIQEGLGLDSEAAGEVYNPFESGSHTDPRYRKYLSPSTMDPYLLSEHVSDPGSLEVEPVVQEAPTEPALVEEEEDPKEIQFTELDEYDPSYASRVVKQLREKKLIEQPTASATRKAQVSHDNYLDESERDSSDYLMPGESFKLKGEVLVRNRGGGLYRIPSGAEGEVIRDIDGTGRMFYACFKNENLKAWVTIHQIEGKKHPRDRQDREYNEGYSQASERPEELG